jgi:hypothetical protein
VRPPGSNFGRHAPPIFSSRALVQPMGEQTKLRVRIDQMRVLVPRRPIEPQDKYSERLSLHLCREYEMDYFAMVGIVDKWLWGWVNKTRRDRSSSEALDTP